MDASPGIKKSVDKRTAIVSLGILWADAGGLVRDVAQLILYCQ